jgi:chemotaxis protein CheD
MWKPSHAIDIFLQPGEFHFGDRGTRIRTILGSCVAITMWHPWLCIGGMCHYMLAASPRRRAASLDGKYGQDAILMFFAEAIRHDSNPRDYVVKVFGGGNMFPGQDGHWPCASRPCEEVIDGCRNVSCKNGMVGRALIRQHGMTIAAEHVGGAGHRNVIFDVATGHVWVRQAQLLKGAD